MPKNTRRYKRDLLPAINPIGVDTTSPDQITKHTVLATLKAKGAESQARETLLRQILIDPRIEHVGQLRRQLIELGFGPTA